MSLPTQWGLSGNSSIMQLRPLSKPSEAQPLAPGCGDSNGGVDVWTPTGEGDVAKGTCQTC
eukprot:279309-Chlamydomonas_euryale.AAC.2